jgi:hypothetical protein
VLVLVAEKLGGELSGFRLLVEDVLEPLKLVEYDDVRL